MAELRVRGRVARPLADALGVQTWFVVGAVVCLAGGIVGFVTPAVMRLEDGRGKPAPLAEGTLSPAPVNVAVE